jgi:peptidyl-prolyl cis-trans isomerase D
MSIQRIRDNSQSLVAKFIIGVIVVSFAFFGVDAIVGFSSESNKVATVNGTDISDVQLTQAEAFLARQILAQLGEGADPASIDNQQVRQQALNNLITRQLLLDNAHMQSLHVSDKRTNSAILNNPSFQTNGIFDRSIYESALRRVYLTPLDYKNQLAQDLLIRQAQSAISDTDFVIRSEIEQIAGLDQQLRDVSYVVIPTTVISDIVVSEDQIQDYYSSHSADFMTEETVTVEYLELKRADFEKEVNVDEASIEQQYQQELKSYGSREERRAAHILVEITDDVNAEAARKKITEALSELNSGRDFGDVAKKYSDDFGSSLNGGDLGFSERGAFVGPFEDTLFAMKEGQVSKIVETEFGLHIIKLVSIRKPEVPSLASIRDRLVQEIKVQKSEELFVAAVDELENDSFSAGDLQEPAKNLGLVVQTTEPFTRTKGSGIAANDSVQAMAFTEEVLKDGVNSDLIEIDQDHVAVIRLKTHQPAVLQPLAEVSSAIKTILSDLKAREHTRLLGDKIVAELKAGASIEQVTKDYPYLWTKLEKVSRNQPDLDSELTDAIFKLPKPEGSPTIGSIVQDNGSYTVVALTGVRNPEREIKSDEFRLLSQYFARASRGLSLSQYHTDLENNADIETF